jgi:hypothetical protein
MQLFISKIDDIAVIQNTDSTFQSSNKKANRGDIKKGKNGQVDLGEGEKKITTAFIVQDSDTFDKLFKVLSKKRECKLTDKFLGIIKVSIDSYTIKNSDKHNGITKIDITFIVNEVFNPTINYKGKIISHIHKLKDNIDVAYLSNNNNISSITTNTYINPVTHNIKKLDKDIQDDFKAKYDDFNRYSTDINRNFNNLNTLLNNGYLNNPIDNIFTKLSSIVNSMNIVKSNIYKVKNYVPRFKVLSNFALSSFGFKSAKAHNKNANSVKVNKMFLIMNLHLLLQVSNKLEMLQTIETLTQLVNDNIALNNNMIHHEDNIINYNNILDDCINYSNNSDIGDIINVKLNYKLVSQYVYRYYGTMDKLADILYLNNLQADTIINGNLKIYKREVA